MLAGEWARRIELSMEDPDQLAVIADELATDHDVSDRERQQLLGRIGQYRGDERKADDTLGVDDEPDDET